jgi:hypothetical protein
MNARLVRAFVVATLLAAALSHTITGLTMLFAPNWFFENIGNFPPFNRHYLGDLGSFQLALGLALLWAVRNPARHWLLIGAAALGNLLHALNHLYDDLNVGSAPSGQTALLFAFALALIAVYYANRRQTEAVQA